MQCIFCEMFVHGCICASLWMNYLANKELKEDEKPSTKGTKIFQIAHAAKYLVVFILLMSFNLWMQFFNS